MMTCLKKLSGGMMFFLAITFLYGVLFFATPTLVSAAFQDFLKTFLSILPILAFVFFIMFLNNVFVKPEAIGKHLGHDSGLRGWLYTLLASMVISGPPYVLFPLLGELKDHGMKYSLITVFLNNRNVQLTFLPVMAYYFGWGFSLIFAFYVVIFAIFSGIVMEKLVKMS